MNVKFPVFCSLILFLILIDNYYFVIGQKSFRLFGDTKNLIRFELKSNSKIYHFDENEIIQNAKSRSSSSSSSSSSSTRTGRGSGGTTSTTTTFNMKPKLSLNSGCKLNFRQILSASNNGNELYGLEIFDCHPMACNSSYYLFTRKLGQIGKVFSNKTDKGEEFHNRRWSAGLSFIYLLQDFEKLPTEDYETTFKPLGDTVQQRTFSLKRIGRQHSILNDFNHSVAFQQSAKYQEETDGIIKSIDVEEIFAVDAFYYKIMEAKIKTTINTINVENEPENPCLTNKLVEYKDCIENFEKNFGYYVITESIEKHFDSILKAKHLETITGENDKTACRLGNERELRNLDGYARKEAIDSFLKLYPRVELLSHNDLWNCLTKYKNTELMHGILTTLALSGKLNAYESVKKLTSEFDHLLYWDIYLSMLPYALDIELPIIKDLLHKIDFNQDTHLPLLLTTASLLHRHRRSLNGQEWKNATSVFISKFDQCQTDQCHELWLQALHNLRSPELVLLAEKHLCTTFKYDYALLKLLKTINANMWDSNKFRNLLFRIYANLCPAQKDQSSRILAAELVLTITPESNLVDIVLKMLNSVNPRTISGREIFSYLLSSVKHQATSDPKFREIGHILHQRRYFNAFLSFLLYGQSVTANRKIEVLDMLQPFFHFGIEFGGGLIKRSEAEIGLSVKGETSVPTISAFELYSTGQSLMTNLISSSSSEDSSDSTTADDDPNTKSRSKVMSTSSQLLPSSDDEDSSDNLPLTAGLKLTFFDHSAPPIIFFNGETELMGAVWSASGDPHVIFNSTFLLNDFSLQLPVASGFLFGMDLKTALSMKIEGSVEISIWYRSLKAAINNKASFGSIGYLSVQSQGQVLSSHNLKFLADLGSSFLADVDFYQTPAKFCFQFDQEPATFRLNLKQDSKLFNVSQWPAKNIKRHFDGTCLELHRRMSRSCTTMYD